MTQTSGDRHLIGVDVGGTKVAAGLVNGAGEISCQTRTPMVANDAAAGLAAVVAAIDSVRAASNRHSEKISHKISGIGICAPGPLNPRSGIVINPPNLPGWRDFPLAAEISKVYLLPVRVDNDGNAAALAEALWGAGIGIFSAPPSAQELEPGLCSMALFITAALAPPRKVVTIPSTIAGRAADAASWAASKCWRPARRLLAGLREKSLRTAARPRSWSWPEAVPTALLVRWSAKLTRRGMCWPKKF